MLSSVSNTHTYRGDSEINFFSDDQSGLSITIDTQRLHIRSVKPVESDYDHYAALFGDREVMEKFANGQTKNQDEIRGRINNVWVKRWREGDPYAGLAVFKNDTDDFLGHVVLGHGETPGESELAYLFNRSHWSKGYGSESVSVVVREYAPATIKEGYTLEGRSLERIVATARQDNPASGRILEKIGMHLIVEEERYGALRQHYLMHMKELQEKPHKKISDPSSSSL